MAKAVNLPPFYSHVKYFDQGTPSGFTTVGLRQFAENNSTLNGVIIPSDIPAVNGQWLNSYNESDGTFTQAQPAFGDLDGIAAPAQLPLATVEAQGAVLLAGDLGGSATSPTVKSTSLAKPLPVDQGGTGTAKPGLVAGTNVTIGGEWPNQTVNGPTGGSDTVPLAKLTTGGTAGSITFLNGIFQSAVHPT